MNGQDVYGEKIPILGQGFVELVGTTVDFVDLEVHGHIEGGLNARLPQKLDAMIARAARASYTKGTKTLRDDTALIDHLMRHRHTSPFEMIEFKFLVRAPLFVVQQLLRHRTANLNQESARYSEIEDRMYLPPSSRMAKQSTTNKQGSGELLDEDAQEQVMAAIMESTHDSYATYQALLNLGLTRELARAVLPTATFTTLVWKCDLHNLLHFLKLRLDPHAQAEIRELAQAMLDLIEPWVPATINSWRNHVLNARTFSEDEMRLLHWMFFQYEFDDAHPELVAPHTCGVAQNMKMPTTRIREFLAKFGLEATNEEIVAAGNAWNQDFPDCKDPDHQHLPADLTT